MNLQIISLSCTIIPKLLFFGDNGSWHYNEYTIRLKCLLLLHLPVVLCVSASWGVILSLHLKDYIAYEVSLALSRPMRKMGKCLVFTVYACVQSPNILKLQIIPYVSWCYWCVYHRGCLIGACAEWMQWQGIMCLLSLGRAWASLSEPHTSVTALRTHVCMLVRLDRPLTVNFKWAHSNISRWWNVHADEYFS